MIDIDGNFKRDLLSDDHNSISLPKALAVYDRRLYYMDPRYERLERVDIATGENNKILMDNEPDLKTFTIFRKRPCKFHSILILLAFIRDYRTNCKNGLTFNIIFH